MKRYYFVDSLRGLAILAVILIHITSSFVTDKSSYIALVLNQISRFAVPVFFIISGWGLTISNKAEGNYLLFLRKQVVKIIFPYTIWSLIYVIFNFLVLSKSVSLIAIITDYFTGDTYYHLYYIPVLFVFYLSYPFVNKILLCKYSTVFFLLLTLISQYLKVELGGFFALNQNIFNWIFYFAFGVWLAKDFDRKLAWLQNKKALSLILLILSVCLIFVDYYYRGDYSQLRWAVIPFSISVILSFIAFDIKSCSLNFYGEHSYDLYLVHPLIIRTLTGVLTFLGVELNPIITMLVMTMVLFGSLHIFICFFKKNKKTFKELRFNNK